VVPPSKLLCEQPVSETVRASPPLVAPACRAIVMWYYDGRNDQRRRADDQAEPVRDARAVVVAGPSVPSGVATAPERA
jgi:hypothetical protein